jgi:hypothetical protein
VATIHPTLTNLPFEKTSQQTTGGDNDELRQNGYKAVDYTLLPLLLLQAMREQQSQIQQLRSELESLKSQHQQQSK